MLYLTNADNLELFTYNIKSIYAEIDIKIIQKTSLSLFCKRRYTRRDRSLLKSQCLLS